MCVEGARVVHRQATSPIESADLAIFVVWLPRYPGDNREKAVAANRNVPDSRAHHFWDADTWLAKQYGQILGLPQGKQFAWDTYMVFHANTSWKDRPPTPNSWMHQMGGTLGRDHPRWLDGSRFRESVNSLLTDCDQ